MLFTSLHRMLHKQKWSYDGDTIMLYILAFSEVIYADFYAKILDWNFRLIDENSQILVFVFVSKLNFSFSFRFVDENCRIFVVVVVFVTKINLFSSTKIFVFIIVDEKNTGWHWCSANADLLQNQSGFRNAWSWSVSFGLIFQSRFADLCLV